MPNELMRDLHYLSLVGGVLACTQCGYCCDVTEPMVMAIAEGRFKSCLLCRKEALVWYSPKHGGWMEWGHVHSAACVHGADPVQCGQLDVDQIAKLEALR